MIDSPSINPSLFQLATSDILNDSITDATDPYTNVLRLLLHKLFVFHKATDAVSLSLSSDFFPLARQVRPTVTKGRSGVNGNDFNTAKDRSENDNDFNTAKNRSRIIGKGRNRRNLPNMDRSETVSENRSANNQLHSLSLIIDSGATLIYLAMPIY